MARIIFELGDTFKELHTSKRTDHKMELDFDDAIDLNRRHFVPSDQLVPDSHEYLFSFVEADLNRVESYMRRYLKCIDERHEGDPDLIRIILDELYNIHPYFRIMESNAAYHFNTIVAGYIIDKYPNDDYKSLLNLAIYRRYGHTPDLNIILKDALKPEDGIFFHDLARIQRMISEWVFVVLDNSNPKFAALSTAQRNALYHALYNLGELPLFESSVEYGMEKVGVIDNLTTQFKFNEESQSEALNAVRSMMNDKSIKTPAIIDYLIEKVSAITLDYSQVVYRISNLEQLLSYEIFQMSKDNLRIKRCRYCNRYFVPSKSNIEYCSRIATGESKPCNEIGQAKVYEKKIATGADAQSLYRKAYKTHYARKMKGVMSDEMFNAWKEDALLKKSLAEKGELDLHEYEKWLKI